MNRLATGLPKPRSNISLITLIKEGAGRSFYTTSQQLYRSIRQQRRYASSKRIRPRTALFFPGQGVQKVGMLTPWLEAFPSTAKTLVEEIDYLLGYKVSKIIEEGPNSALTATENAQPAIMSSSILILQILEKEFGFKPAENVDVTLGHSLGEFAALVAGGFVDFEDSLYLVRKRAEVMADCSRRACAEHGGEYGMVALVTEPDHLIPLIEAIHDFLGHHSAGSKSESAEDMPPIQQVLIANINSKNQIVLSGNIERIRTLLTHVRQFGGHDPRAVRLKSDSPFHSPLMKPAATAMKRLLEGKSRVKGRENEDLVTFPGVMECVSNVSARPFESKEDLKDLWARQCVETVKWWDSIRYLDQERNIRRWIGIGPGKNNPLHISIFPSAPSNTPLRTPIQYSLLLSSTLDIFEARSKINTNSGGGLSGDFGLLHAVDERLAAYGFETNTGVRFVAIVDMRGRAIAGGGREASTTGGLGLREGEMKIVFRAMQAAYVRLLQNPFYEPDEHSPPTGRGGKKITSKRFAEDVRRIGEGWTPGSVNL
ncbi:malonyl CoA-acyl carrier protein transacylase [Marssonina coronariae]|uniref:[acyl-carrier-protein] S-malonyltransferase n=1 Tax=Diplocarpon coronariae TaxID=2795749 RepID=A0A218YSC3_9HELO|nr:malonyl CoA-acyl carrier protein transacylase [Marssonina coronariae]